METQVGVVLEEALKDAPELAKRLREQHGDRVSVGRIWESPRSMLATEPAGTTYVNILVDGNKFGIYERDWDIGGTWAQRYNGGRIEH